MLGKGLPQIEASMTYSATWKNTHRSYAVWPVNHTAHALHGSDFVRTCPTPRYSFLLDTLYKLQPSRGFFVWKKKKKIYIYIYIYIAFFLIKSFFPQKNLKKKVFFEH